MSVRAAIVTLVVELRITDEATEGQMVDEAICMIEDAGYTTRNLGGNVEKKVLSATVETKGTGGNL